MEKVKSANFRIGGYAASAAGAEAVMRKGNLEKALDMLKKRFPNAAMVTGASESGGMGYLDRAAREAGMVTIGVATQIPGQETPNDAPDAITHHDRYNFIPRQGLIARMVSMALVDIGAEGTDFEQSIHRVLLKIALGSMCPISYVDPVGLGPNGQHMYRDPIMQLQKTYSTLHDGLEEPFTLSRSPYVGNLLRFPKQYPKAVQRLEPFFDDPVKYLKQRGVPQQTIELAIDSIIHDAEYTGLPVHAFWEEEVNKRKNK